MGLRYEYGKLNKYSLRMVWGGHELLATDGEWRWSSRWRSQPLGLGWVIHVFTWNDIYVIGVDRIHDCLSISCFSGLRCVLSNALSRFSSQWGLLTSTEVQTFRSSCPVIILDRWEPECSESRHSNRLRLIRRKRNSLGFSKRSASANSGGANYQKW